jgi:hypothetical protein
MYTSAKEETLLDQHHLNGTTYISLTKVTQMKLSRLWTFPNLYIEKRTFLTKAIVRTFSDYSYNQPRIWQNIRANLTIIITVLFTILLLLSFTFWLKFLNFEALRVQVNKTNQSFGSRCLCLWNKTTNFSG